MILTLDVTAGPGAGKKLALRPGEVGHVGRADWTQLRLPPESQLAGTQFAVECGLQGCSIKAETWDRPILLNGKNILGVNQSQRHPLNDGDEIVVGPNKFHVSIGSTTSAAKTGTAAAAPVVAKSGGATDLVKLLDAAQPLFALVDAARQPKLVDWLKQSKLHYESLYNGYKAMELDRVAPYLVHLPQGVPALRELAQNGWGQSWGVYLTCAAPFKETRQHLRRFLTVESDGKRMLFRFYDPRVLRAFLPACNAEEHKQFFGPIAAFLMEDKEPVNLLRFTADNAGKPNRVEVQLA